MIQTITTATTRSAHDFTILLFFFMDVGGIGLLTLTLALGGRGMEFFFGAD